EAVEGLVVLLRVGHEVGLVAQRPGADRVPDGGEVPGLADHAGPGDGWLLVDVHRVALLLLALFQVVHHRPPDRLLSRTGAARVHAETDSPQPKRPAAA